jgi:hypothetical protein
MVRKPKPEAGKRYPLNMRTTRELRERIIAAAHASGRSLVQEVEYRLERSFQLEDQQQSMTSLVDKAVNASTAAMERMIIQHIGAAPGQSQTNPPKPADTQERDKTP